MSDLIATFPLRDSDAASLGIALGRSFADFWVWYGQALFVSGFARDAVEGGVKGVIADRIHESLNFGESEGLIFWSSAKTKDNRSISHDLADNQLTMADHGVKLAAVVMLHNAYERHLWRLVRFGMVGNRERALEWIAKKNVSVETLMTDGVDKPVDALLEKWWHDLERDSLIVKWDRLTGLVGLPNNLSSPPGTSTGTC